MKLGKTWKTDTIWLSKTRRIYGITEDRKLNTIGDVFRYEKKVIQVIIGYRIIVIIKKKK